MKYVTLSMIYHAQSYVVITSVLLWCKNCCNHEVFHRPIFPSTNPATPIVVFLHPSIAVRFYPPPPFSSLSPRAFLHNQAFLHFYTNPPFLFAIFFPSMGVDPCFILSLPSHSSLILFDYLPLIPRRDGKLLCCWFSKTKLWKVRMIQSQHVHKVATPVGKSTMNKKVTIVVTQTWGWLLRREECSRNCR
jgi:hypothetical protein